MFGRVILQLGITAFVTLSACSGRRKEKEQNSCWRETPNGRLPCDDKFVERPASSISDSDGDRVPDEQDLCPSEPNIGSPDGCGPVSSVINSEAPTPACANDTDRDNINDCDDQCPDSYGILEAAGCTEMVYPLSRDTFRLVPTRTETFSLGEGIICPHFPLFSRGRQLFFDATIVDTVEEDGYAPHLCSLGRTVLPDSIGGWALLWNRGQPGFNVSLLFQRLNAEAQLLGVAYLLDTFPMPNLGPRGDNRIASMAVKSDGTAVVVWANRDKILLREFSSEGLPGPERLVNERRIEVERNINPDVAVDADGNIAVVWQEGTGDTGPIHLSVLEVDGTMNPLVVSDRPKTRMPSVQMGDENVAVVWEESVIQFALYEQREGRYVRSFERTLMFLDNSRTDTLLSPSILWDAQGRLAAQWQAEQPDTLSRRIYLKSQGENSVVEEMVPNYWSRLIPGPEGVSLLFAGRNPNEWNVNSFAWEGSERAVWHPSIAVEPSSVQISARRPEALHIENRGLFPLEFSATDGTEDYFAHIGNEVLEPGTGKIFTAKMPLDGNRGGVIRLRTNDPENPTVAIPVAEF